jgi:hypothetical protein
MGIPANGLRVHPIKSSRWFTGSGSFARNGRRIVPPAALSFFLLLFLLVQSSPAAAQSSGLYSRFLSQATAGSQRITWPLVYPERYKISAMAGLSSIRTPTGRTPGLAAGLAGELLFAQTFLAGFGWEITRAGGTDSLSGAVLHRIAFQGGFIVPIGQTERHHITGLFRAGLGLLRSEEGGGAGAGLSFGLAYEYSLNSDYILAPEIMWHRYTGPASFYSLSGRTLGLRLHFGR